MASYMTMTLHRTGLDRVSMECHDHAQEQRRHAAAGAGSTGWQARLRLPPALQTALCSVPCAPHLKQTQMAKSGEPRPCCIATAVDTLEQSEECEEGMPPLSKNARRLNTPVLYALVNILRNCVAGGAG